MCGLVGFLGGSVQFDTERGVAMLRKMADKIVNRGPDDDGYWCDAKHRIGLGHRRLAVIDLSQAGHQPMLSASGRYVIAFNGEIYNHADMRADLSSTGYAPDWRGHSDTETFLAGFEHWGIEGTLQRSTGMFAFALWDRKDNVLTLGRDRLGEKPLYYGWQDDTLLFGSELSALRAHSAFSAGVDRDALCLFLRHGYIPAPYSIYEGIRKLQPGCYLSFLEGDDGPVVRSYWSAVESAVSGAANPFTGSREQAVDELERLARNSVRQQMHADVPLGAFLSGGIDSSTIVALAQAQSSRSVKTFSVGFHEAGYNEAEHAKSVAKHLGTEHTELYVTPEEAMAVIPDLPKFYCEPFADSSQIPTVLVSRMARKDVTVALSGDGGDELFCGYSRYPQSARAWRRLSGVPRVVRKMVAGGTHSISPARWDLIGRLLPKSRQIPHLGDRMHKFAQAMTSSNIDDFYLNFMLSHHRNPDLIVRDGREPPTMNSGNVPHLPGLDEYQRMMAIDIVSYLPDDILAKVDRAAMSVSLESRVPFLDHQIVEFALSLPQAVKLHDGDLKWILRQLLYRYVPPELIDRPKKGFSVPIEHWLRGPLRDWAETLLDEKRLQDEGYFDPTAVRKMWSEYLFQSRRWHGGLWNILMFQSWLEEQKAA